MKRIGLIFSLFIVLMCSGCGPILEPLIEGTYTSYNEEKNETVISSTYRQFVSVCLVGFDNGFGRRKQRRM